MVDLFRVGVISSTHGIRGEVKVFPTTDNLVRFKKLKNVILQYKNEKIDCEIESVKFFKNMIILKFKGFNSINDIEKYKGCELFVTRENAVPLKENEYYIADVIGMKVLSDDDTLSGIVKDVLQTGANDVLVVDSENIGEILFPVIKECVTDMDFETGIIKVHIMKGLID